MHSFCSLQQRASRAQWMLHFSGLHIGAGVVGVLLEPASRVVLPASLLVAFAGGVEVLGGVLVAGVFVLGVLATGVLVLLEVLVMEDGSLVLTGALVLVAIGAAGGMGTLKAGVLSTAASLLASEGKAPPASRPLSTFA